MSLINTGREIGPNDIVAKRSLTERLNRIPDLGTPVAAVAAALSTNLSGANNDLDYTAVTKGVIGNDITIAYVNPGTASASLSVAVTDKAIVFNLATDAGVAASLTTSLTGSNNDLVFTANSIGTAGNSITIAYIDPSANDQTLSVEVTGTDIVVNLATDGGGSITSTAALIKAAIEADEDADALVTITNAGGNDGSGVVTALTETALTGGAAIAITSTGDTIKTALLASAAASALVTAADKSGNDGSGVVTAMTATALSGGVDGTAGNAGDMLLDADYLYYTITPSTTAETNWLKIESASL